MRGDTRGLVVYMCDGLMIFLPFTSVFSFRVSCITASLTLFFFPIPPHPRHQNCFDAFLHAFRGPFVHAWKNCHRLRDFRLTTSSFAASKSGLFSTSIDSLHVYSILRLNWALSALESIKISASQICLALNTKRSPSKADEGAVNALTDGFMYTL